MLNSFVIVLTRKCYPCSCNYCNVLKKDFNDFWDDLHKDKNYFKFILQNIVKFLNKNNYKSIRFFGGEVLLKKEILIFFIKNLKQYGFDGDIIVNTNLHLFEKKDIDWIKKYNVKIITSLNGFSDLHCKTRGVKENDYKKLLGNIKFLLQNNVDLQINTVLFPYEEDFIKKIKFILDLKPTKINLLPLMYSNLINSSSIDYFIKKIEKLFIWIKKNKLHNNFLNFILIEDDNSSSFPLVTDELVLDSDGDIYISMLVLENIISLKKDILYLENIKNIESLEINKYNTKISLQIVFEFLKKQDIFMNSVKLSNFYLDLLNKYH